MPRSAFIFASHAMNAAAASCSVIAPAPGTPATRASSAIFAVAADRLKRITWSIMIPLARPWWRSATVDSACAQECTAPRSFWKAIAPIIELISMSLRACEIAAVAEGDRQRPRGDAHAFERDAVAQRMVLGRQVRLDVVRERVHAGGRGDAREEGRSVSSGSANTHFASSAGEKMIFLTCVASSETTDERPTSEPVPAVVGSATK